MLSATLSRFLFCFLLVVLASCHSARTVFQPAKLGTSQAKAASVPVLTYEARAGASGPVTNKPVVTLKADAQQYPGKVARKAKVNLRKMLRQSVAVAKRTVQPHRVVKPNTTAVQEEGEGKPALLVLGIVLAVGGVIAGFMIGGGAGFFVGLPVFMLGYYFFMKGLLGPNAWIEVVNELFQL